MNRRRTALFRVLRYMDCVGQPGFLREAIAEGGANEVVRAIRRLLRRASVRDRALLFLDDCFALPSCAESMEFRDAVVASGAWAELSNLLFETDDVHFRSQLVEMISAAAFPDSAEILERLVPFCSASDPLLLPLLISEIRWVRGSGDERTVGMLQDLSRSDQVFCRWAVVAYFGQYQASPGMRLSADVEAILQSLAKDQAGEVSREASYLLALNAFMLELPSLTREDARAKGRVIRGSCPRPTFNEFAHTFHVGRNTAETGGYSIRELFTHLETGNWSAA